MNISNSNENQDISSGYHSRLNTNRIYGLGMDALVIGYRIHSNTNRIMVWAWMLWLSHSFEHEQNYGLGMDVLVITLIRPETELWFRHGCSGYRIHSTTNRIMVWAWMLWLSHSFEHQTDLWFGHGCSGYRTPSNTNRLMVWAWMLWLSHSFDHKQNCGLGMDALVIAFIRPQTDLYGLGMNVLVIALCRTQRELWFGHGCSGYRIHSTTNRLMWFGHGCSGYRTPSNTNRMMVWAWMLWLSHSVEHKQNYGLVMNALVIALIQPQTELWFGHGCSGYRSHSTTNRIMVWAWMFWLSHSVEHKENYGLCMDVLVIAFIRPQTDLYGLGMDVLVIALLRTQREDALVIALIRPQTELWFGHGCSGYRTHLNTNRIMVWAWMFWLSHSFEHKQTYMVWAWMFWLSHSFEHKQNYGLGMDALVIAFIRPQTDFHGLGMNVLVIALCRTQRELWFGHGCSGYRTPSNTKQTYGLGMDALVIALIRPQTELWFGHGCSGYRIHSTTNRLIWFGHGCSGYRIPSNTNRIMVWAWMFWLSHSFEHKANYGLGMDVLVIALLRTQTE